MNAANQHCGIASELQVRPGKGRSNDKFDLLGTLLPKIDKFDLLNALLRNQNLFANKERAGEQQSYMLKHVATLLHRRLAAKALLKPNSALIVRKIPQKYNKTEEANAIHQMNKLKYSLVLNGAP